MMDNIQDKINKQADDSQKKTLWGKPANDILNGRDRSASAKPIRAIWEMVQNARDESLDKSNIVFIRKHGEFVFKHDGMPFTNDTLSALILQTSAKSRNDGDQAGQYGTGFLTTHKFGRKILLAGSLKLVDDEELYYNFPELIVDRSPNTQEEMVRSLAEQFKEKNRWKEDLAYRRDYPERWTVFTYLQPNEIEGKNVEEAFEQAPELIPYVLCLNESVKTITLMDEVLDNTISYSRGEKKAIEDTSLAIQYSTPITIVDSIQGKTDTIIIQSLESKKTVTTKKGVIKPMVTIVLPVSENKIIHLSDNIAKLFIYLPLVGTEQWGINFIIHAPMFTCSSDDRSSLRLIMDGQTENDPAKENRKYIQEATDLVFDYVKQHIIEWQNIHYLAPIYFDVSNANKELSDYYKSLKNHWLQNMRELEIVTVQTGENTINKKPSTIYVLDSVLTKAIQEKEELLMPFYNVLSIMHKDAVPVPNQLAYWGGVFAHWYEGESCYQIINISYIVDFIAANGLSVVTEKDLLKICEYLRDSEQLSFFDKNILLTEEGTLTNKTEGYKCDSIGEKLKSIIKVLLPEYTSKFVKDGFADLIKLPIFGCKDIKDALSTCTETLQTKIKSVSDAAKTVWETSKSTSISTDGILNISQRNALMDYCRMVIPGSSTAFQAKALELVQEYYEYDFDLTETLDTDFFEWRGAIRTLLGNVLTEFTLLVDDDKKKKVDWIKRLITYIFNFSDFNGMLQNYRIYLSQSEEFHYCKELKKDVGIPEKMKDIFNKIASTSEKTVDIRKDLFNKEFGRIALTESTCETVLFGKEIMRMILESGKYISEIDSYEHKDLIMDIIDNFDDEKDGLIWQSAFETIYKDIPSLLAKLVLNKDNREPMIKIMKVKDKARLNKAAEIINDENLLSIWEMGKEVWIEMQNEQKDFEKKKELGNYVEDCLRKELKNELSKYELEVKVDDVQNGQDIIISINSEPIYYIEVKSRWKVADSVMMSAKQLERSVEKKECYSLFAVEMVGFNDENVKEHIYPKVMEEFISRIRVVTEIGNMNDDILPTKRDPIWQVHIGGDYKAIVPQKLIENNCIDYNSFVNMVLKPKVIEAIQRLSKCSF